MWLPDGVDDAKVRGELRVRFGIEVGGGLGDLAGKGWRIGLMGHSARERSVVTLLGALRSPLVDASGNPPIENGVSRYTQELLALSAQPAAAEQVLRIVSNPMAGAADVARVVETDPALAARVDAPREQPVLRRAPPREQHAARDRDARLRHRARPRGERGVQPARRPRRGRARRFLAPRDHDRVRGVGDRPQGRRVRPRDAFSAGLLHDLGAVLLHRRDADAFAEAMASPSMSDQVAAELAAFGVTHADEGAAALDAWGFPAPFVEAVAFHQHGVEEPQHALGRVLRVAEAVALEHAPMPGYPTPPDVDRLLLGDPPAARRPRRRSTARSTASSNGSPTSSESSRERRRGARRRSPGSTRSSAQPRAARRTRDANRALLVELLEASCLLELAKIEATRLDPATYLQLAVDVIAQMYPVQGVAATVTVPGVRADRRARGRTADRRPPLSARDRRR